MENATADSLPSSIYYMGLDKKPTSSVKMNSRSKTGIVNRRPQ